MDPKCGASLGSKVWSHFGVQNMGPVLGPYSGPFYGPVLSLLGTRAQKWVQNVGPFGGPNCGPFWGPKSGAILRATLGA